MPAYFISKVKTKDKVNDICQQKTDNSPYTTLTFFIKTDAVDEATVSFNLSQKLQGKVYYFQET